jgi:hypothetical protein
LLQKTSLFGFSNILAVSCLPDEDYSRNTSCTLSLISRVLLQLEEAQRRQEIMVSIMKKELEHSQRMVSVIILMNCINVYDLTGKLININKAIMLLYCNI